VWYGHKKPQQISGNQSYSKVCGTRQSNNGYGAPFVFDSMESDLKIEHLVFALD